MPTDKPLLILDLDETLLHATLKPLAGPPDFVTGPYHVYRRPFLEGFLNAVQPKFEIAIWSSASDDYVTALLGDLTSAPLPLAFQWARTRCVRRYDPEWQTEYWVKDLRKVTRLGYNLNRILIVDDTPQKLERNYGSAVYVQPFEGEPADQELLHLGPYLLSLADRSDFRCIEKRGWRLK